MPYSFPYGYRKSVPYNLQTRTNGTLNSNANHGELRVLGEGFIQAEPDIALVSLGVQTRGMELRQVQQENAEISSKIIAALNGIGVSSDDIQTQSYNIFPQYEYINGQQKFNGYVVEHILRVTIKDINLVGEIVDLAVESGANVINNVTFAIANPSQYYQQALLKAIDDATAKAMFIGRNMNINVSTIPIEIIEQSSIPFSPYSVTLAKTDIATPIQPGQMDIAARVEAVFTY
ncbi:SIMPL domain-containing protein [Defluviitalea saccharophila]|uniref:SIMPL domain-containing protein n=1 Tax=Defluviitalea saccharophila TaxID=879970 RepID=A0ABZ2Y3R9_9FIRM